MEKEEKKQQQQKQKKSPPWKRCSGAKTRNDFSGEHNPGVCRKYEVKRNISSARKQI